MEKLQREEEDAKAETIETIVGEHNMDTLFSPRFKAVAAMAGWDEESILVASLIVDDTPDREFKHVKRSGFRIITPSSNSRSKKRKSLQKNHASISIPMLNLDEEESTKTGNEKHKEPNILAKEHDEASETPNKKRYVQGLPCMDKLREELSCTICLEICYEPTTTTCGHSFCKKCLRSAADRCGKRCPKCRQFISCGRSCTVNTVLWNTIQLLFPQEIESRKPSPDSKKKELRPMKSGSHIHHHRDARAGPDQDEGFARAQRLRRDNLMRVLGDGRRSRDTDDDATLALRLQRDEFEASFGDPYVHRPRSVAVSRANLREMATRASSVRARRYAMHEF